MVCNTLSDGMAAEVPRRKWWMIWGQRGLQKLNVQVLFKRKPVQYLPQTVIEDDSSEVCTSIPHTADFPSYPLSSFQVWVIPETNEVFTSYEPYLQRMDFYKQRRFICEITGHSGLTFFEALRSEVYYNMDTE